MLTTLRNGESLKDLMVHSLNASIVRVKHLTNFLDLQQLVGILHVVWAQMDNYYVELRKVTNSESHLSGYTMRTSVPFQQNSFMAVI